MFFPLRQIAALQCFLQVSKARSLWASVQILLEQIYQMVYPKYICSVKRRNINVVYIRCNIIGFIIKCDNFSLLPLTYIVVLHITIFVGKDEKPDVQYSDIGGMDIQKQEVREAVELPLTHFELYKQIGIDPPRGVLMFGPPGCGKTMLAKAVAHHTTGKISSYYLIVSFLF